MIEDERDCEHKNVVWSGFDDANEFTFGNSPTCMEEEQEQDDKVDEENIDGKTEEERKMVRSLSHLSIHDDSTRVRNSHSNSLKLLNPAQSEKADNV